MPAITVSAQFKKGWTVAATGAYFAFNVLPTIIFFSALMSVLYSLNIMQLGVKGIAWVMMRTLRTSGAETLSASGNIFVGQTEAPLVIRPYIAGLSRSGLFAVMVGGLSTVAGSVLVGYSLAELRLRTWQEITHPDDLDGDLALGRRVVAHEILLE